MRFTAGGTPAWVCLEIGNSYLTPLTQNQQLISLKPTPQKAGHLLTRKELPTPSVLIRGLSEEASLIVGQYHWRQQDQQQQASVIHSTPLRGGIVFTSLLSGYFSTYRCGMQHNFSFLLTPCPVALFSSLPRCEET